MADDRIDIDLTGVDQANPTVPDGTYTIELTDCELSRSTTDRPMLRCAWELPDPKNPDSDNIRINDYPLLDTQRGKFRLRQIIYAKGMNDSTWDKKAVSLIGTRVKAELTLEDDPEYGEQDRIRRLLQEVPKAAKR